MIIVGASVMGASFIMMFMWLSASIHIVILIVTIAMHEIFFEFFFGSAYEWRGGGQPTWPRMVENTKDL